MEFYAKIIRNEEGERQMPYAHSSYVKGYQQRSIHFSITGRSSDAARLAILLPGGGYTTQAPLFHYASSMFLDASIDVLKINYRYNDEFYDDFSWEELTKAVNHDVNAVLDHALSDKGYRQYVFLGKSIGTLCMESILNRDDIEEAKAIWVTPLLKEESVTDTLAQSKYPSLCIIGDKDPNYIPERLERIKRNPLVTARLVPNMHHGLEHEGHILDSVDMLKSIIKDMKDFI